MKNRQGRIEEFEKVCNSYLKAAIYFKCREGEEELFNLLEIAPEALEIIKDLEQENKKLKEFAEFSKNTVKELSSLLEEAINIRR